MTSSNPLQTPHGPAIEWLVFDLGGVRVDVAPPGEIVAEMARGIDARWAG